MISPEILRRFSYFAGLDAEFLKELAMIGQEIVLADGVWLFHEDDEADALYLILTGSVDLKAKIGRTGKYTDVERLIDGEITGWSALVEPYVYTLSAMTPNGARLVRLDGPALRQLVAGQPDAGCQLMCRLAHAIGKRLTHMRVRFVSLVEA